MQLFAFGVNHTTAPLALREQVVFHAENLVDALRELVERRPVKEAAIISTCNRTEVYCNTEAPAAVVDWLAGYHSLNTREIEPYLYQLPRERAVKHAFRVASGLDSLVLGEPQILGQFKQAVRTAQAAGTLGLVLNKLFQRTFSVAKSVRSETEIGAATVSMAAAAVSIAQRIYPSIAEQRVLFIGAGEMIELTATHFAAHHPRRMTFANRTPERAQHLADRFLGRAIALNDLASQLAVHDIVVSSTASPMPIIGKGLTESALKARKHRPMLMLDLAVPRDIEGEVGRLDDVFLYTVDDLGRIAREGMDTRQNAVAQAEVIIENQVTDFMHWLGNRELVPTIRALRDSAERARRHEVERALRRLTKGEDPKIVLESLSHALSNKLLHPPTHALSHAREDDRAELAQLLARLYQIRLPRNERFAAAGIRLPRAFPVKPSIAAKLAQLAKRLEEITQLLGQETATADLDQYRRLTREHAEIAPVVALYQKYASGAQDIETAQQMASDPAMREFADGEIRETRERLAGIERELQQLLLPKDANDERNIFLEIRAGTGGDESALFAGELFRMYTRYAERNGWQVEVISQSWADRGGCKEVIAKVIGRGVYSKLKFESGGHRVQRVPVTETQGRIHTSACTVAVMPEADEIADVVLNPAELRVDTFRASGAGGQHVNKTDSAIRVTHLPTGIVVECQDDRSQHKNRARALAVLAARIKDKQIHEQQAKIAATRKSLIGSGDRSERIRTYNFPQGRVTDHRINLTLYKIDRIMDGELDELVSALTAEHQTEQLAQLAEETQPV